MNHLLTINLVALLGIYLANLGISYDAVGSYIFIGIYFFTQIRATIIWKVSQYFWIAALNIGAIFILLVLSISQSNFDLNYITILFTVLSITASILPIWLSKMLSSNTSISKEKYTNNMGKLKLRKVYHFD